jgi:cupin superfamily acireductone dioxygenase involved in methionine salvage
MNGGGILPQYQGLGIDAIMFCEMHRIVQEYGFQHIDVVQINEQNTKMRREAETLGADWYKTHRIYEREL